MRNRSARRRSAAPRATRTRQMRGALPTRGTTACRMRGPLPTQGMKAHRMREALPTRGMTLRALPQGNAPRPLTSVMRQRGRASARPAPTHSKQRGLAVTMAIPAPMLINATALGFAVVRPRSATLHPMLLPNARNVRQYWRLPVRPSRQREKLLACQSVQDRCVQWFRTMHRVQRHHLL